MAARAARGCVERDLEHVGGRREQLNHRRCHSPAVTSIEHDLAAAAELSAQTEQRVIHLDFLEDALCLGASSVGAA
eukprot:2666859-Pleurochrysis_carterae.AAC.2